MAYKDKDKQKQAQRERTRRYREKTKGVTSEGVTQGFTQGVTSIGTVTPPVFIVTPEGQAVEVPANYGLEGCACRHCAQDKGRHTLNHGAYKTAQELADGEMNRVSLPGDVDCKGKAGLRMMREQGIT